MRKEENYKHTHTSAHEYLHALTVTSHKITQTWKMDADFQGGSLVV